MKPSGKSYIVNIRLHHEGTQCGGTMTLYVSFSSDTPWRWPKTTPETRRSVSCSLYAPYNLVVCLSLTRNIHNMKRFADYLCKGDKRLRHYKRHCEPPNHTNINVVLNLIKKNQGQSFARKFILASWTSGMRLSVFTYLLTPWSKVLLEKLTGLQLFKQFPIFYGIRRFITAFTSARHLPLSWDSSIQSKPPHPTSWGSILILSSHLRLGHPSDLFSSGFPTKTMYRPLLSPISVTCSAHLLLLDWSPEQYWVSSTNHSFPHYAASCTSLLHTT